MEKNTCHDCGKKLKKGEEYVLYESVEKKFVKCKACHQKESRLKNFQKAEVYSRVVGYIRPVEQWNKGKQAEFCDRKEFKIVRKKTVKKSAAKKRNK
jgi:anaerobic ribonucleoside-triphosphate reductase